MLNNSWRNALLAMGAVALAFGPLTANAVPVVYSIADGGLDGAYICTVPTNCGNVTTTRFTYSAPAGPDAFDAASGTITLDATAGTVSYSISVASGTFLAVGDVPDNGVDEIEFTSLTYSGAISGASFTPSGPDTVISWTAQQPTGAGVSGSYEQLLNGGNVNGPDGFSNTARMAAGTCLLTAANNLTCGFAFGPGGNPTFFQIAVGPDGSPVNRRVIHTLNVVAVPEPGTALLVALGIAAVAMRGRSR